jgi:hypothetical protein
MRKRKRIKKSIFSAVIYIIRRSSAANQIAEILVQLLKLAKKSQNKKIYPHIFEIAGNSLGHLLEEIWNTSDEGAYSMQQGK